MIFFTTIRLRITKKLILLRPLCPLLGPTNNIITHIFQERLWTLYGWTWVLIYFDAYFSTNILTFSRRCSFNYLCINYSDINYWWANYTRLTFMRGVSHWIYSCGHTYILALHAYWGKDSIPLLRHAHNLL